MSTPPNRRGWSRARRGPSCGLVVVAGRDEHPVAGLGGVHRGIDGGVGAGDALPGAHPQHARCGGMRGANGAHPERGEAAHRDDEPDRHRGADAGHGGRPKNLHHCPQCSDVDSSRAGPVAARRRQRTRPRPGRGPDPEVVAACAHLPRGSRKPAIMFRPSTPSEVLPHGPSTGRHRAPPPRRVVARRELPHGRPDLPAREPAAARAAATRAHQAAPARPLGHVAGAQLPLRAPEPGDPARRPRRDLPRRARATAARRSSPTSTSRAPTPRSTRRSPPTWSGCSACSASSRRPAASRAT